MAEKAKEAKKLPEWMEEAPPLPAWMETAPAAQEAAPAPSETPVPPEVGAWETYVNRATDAVPLGRLTSNLSATALLRALRPSPGARLTPQARAELEAMGGQEATPPGLLDTYRDVRDTRAQRTAAGSEQNPWAGRAGTATGVTLSVLAPGPKFAANNPGSALSRIAAAGKTGAAYGALQGATDGPADLTRGDVGGFARDVATNAALGGLFGLGASGLTEVGRPVLANALQRLGIQQGRQAIQGGSDIAVGTRKRMTDDAVREAYNQRAIRPFRTTEAIYDDLERIAAEKGKTLGDMLRELEDLGVEGPRIKALTDELAARKLAATVSTGANKAEAEALGQEAENLKELARYGPYTPELERLPLTRSEEIKRALQEAAKLDRLRQSGAEEGREGAAYVMRQGGEDAILDAAMTPGVAPRVQQLAADFVPTKNELGRLLEARRFAELGATKAAGRSPVGLLPTIMGMATSGGNAAQGAVNAAAFSFARNRTPSTLGYAAYNLGRGLETGSTAADIAAALGTEPDVVAGLIEALRRRNGGDQPSEGNTP